MNGPQAMPAHLGGKEPSTRSHQDSSKEVCGKSVLDPIDFLGVKTIYYFSFHISLECATNHKVLDKSNSRIVGGTVVVPNSLPWQAFIRINKSFRSGSSVYVSGVLAC